MINNFDHWVDKNEVNNKRVFEEFDAKILFLKNRLIKIFKTYF